MSIFNTPFLAQLSNVIEENETIRLYNQQTSPVEWADATPISTRGYDLMRVTVRANNPPINLRVSGLVYENTREYLDVYDFNTKELQPYYGSGAYKSGIRGEGDFVVSVAGVSSVRLPLTDTGGSGVTVYITLARSFGAFMPNNPVNINKSRHEQIIFTNDQKHGAFTALGSAVNNTEFFVPRAVGSRYLESIPHSNQGIFEQSFFLRNETSQTMKNISLGGDLTESNVLNRDRITNSFISIPELEAGGSLFFTSDKSDYVSDGNRAKIYAVHELRLPIWKLRLAYTFENTLSSGNIYLQSIRRY